MTSKTLLYQTDQTFIKRFLKEATQKDRIRSFFLMATLVGILVAGALYFAFLYASKFDPSLKPKLIHSLISSLTYSYTISMWIHLTVALHKAWKLWLPPRLEKPIFIITLLLGVIESSLLASLFNFWTCGHGKIEDIWNFVIPGTLFAMFVSAISVAAGYIYDRLLKKLERALEEIKSKELEEHRLRKLKVEAELQALQAKINPHFLFNTLNSIASLISIDPDKAEKAVEQLSTLFRLTLKHSLTGSIALRDSLQTVQSYLDLEKMRLGKRLEYNIETKGDVLSIQLPALLIQPLVENAIKHGIAPKIDGGHINVLVESIGAKCHIQVSDNGIGWQEKESDSGHGLLNIRERMRLLFGKNWNLEITSKNGVCIDVTFPLEKEK